MRDVCGKSLVPVIVVMQGDISIHPVRVDPGKYSSPHIAQSHHSHYIPLSMCHEAGSHACADIVQVIPSIGVQRAASSCVR